MYARESGKVSTADRYRLNTHIGEGDVVGENPRDQPGDPKCDAEHSRYFLRRRRYRPRPRAVVHAAPAPYVIHRVTVQHFDVARSREPPHSRAGQSELLGA